MKVPGCDRKAVDDSAGERGIRYAQFRNRGNLPCNGRRFEIRHLIEAQVDAHLLRGIIAELVVHSEADARLDRGHSRIEIVHVEFEKLAVRDFRLFDTGSIAGEIGEYAHDKWNLNFFLGIGRILVGNVNPRRTVAPDEFLSAFFGHVFDPLCCWFLEGVIQITPIDVPAETSVSGQFASPGCRTSLLKFAPRVATPSR